MTTQHIITTADLFTADGHLLAAKGATGVIANRLGDTAVVTFDMAQMTHVAPDANGRLNRMVPMTHITELGAVAEHLMALSLLGGDVGFQSQGDLFEVGGRCDEGGNVYEPEADEAPHFWSVYQRPAAGGLAEWVADYESKGVAFAVAEHMANA